MSQILETSPFKHFIYLLAEFNQQENNCCNFSYIPRLDRHLHLSSQTLVFKLTDTSVCHAEHKCLSINFLTFDNQHITQTKEEACELIPPTSFI